MLTISSQNLRDKGSAFWHGRAWFRSRGSYDEKFHIEWSFGKFASGFDLRIWLGYGDSDSGVNFHVCLPWLFSLYLVIPHVYHCKECYTGIAVHNQAIWLYPLPYAMESNKSDPWYRQTYSWAFPWSYDWLSTEILEHKANLPGLAKTVHMEKGRHSRLSEYDRIDAIKKSVSETYDYTYTLKNGQVQHCKATVYVDRMTWRARWHWILPFKKVRTSICITFSDEVGEGTGSYKGGCTGCGYDMQHGETPLECLRRMERERKFNR